MAIRPRVGVFLGLLSLFGHILQKPTLEYSHLLTQVADMLA